MPTPLIYPGCTPDFRILQREDGTQVLQVRQVNLTNNYVGKWQDIPVVREEVTDTEPIGK
jgi:hypothetical protein